MIKDKIIKAKNLEVKGLSDLVELIKESEEKGGEMTIEESFLENDKKLKLLFSKGI